MPCARFDFDSHSPNVAKLRAIYEFHLLMDLDRDENEKESKYWGRPGWLIVVVATMPQMCGIGIIKVLVGF